MFNKLRKTYHFLLAWLGCILYEYPSRNIFILGITGTKGKSTVAELVGAIMESAGKRVAIASSVRFKIGPENQENRTGMTMPGRFFLQQFLRKAVNKECQYAIIEVTSQGVSQHRDAFIDFDSALLTNLQPEHIEAHGSFENYRESKLDFFRNVGKYSLKKHKTFLINSLARDNEFFAGAASNFGKIVFFSKDDLKKLKWKIKLLGNFNMENIAAAIAFARSQNVDWETIKSAVENFDGVPGRLEFVQKIPFSVIVDYAHTPDSLEKVYQAIEEKNKGKMICVLGCAGGGRDCWKRPVMGEIASKYCDEIILTDEDPFDDDPEMIIDEISEGISGYSKNKQYKKILDRKKAIEEAVKMAKKNDMVIITGKGSEPYMRVKKGEKISWNEREIVLDILRKLKIEI